MNRTLKTLLCLTALVCTSAYAQSATDLYLQEQLRKQDSGEFATVVDKKTLEREKQAEGFARVYTNFCIKNILDLEGLRKKMPAQAVIPKERAMNFLQGQEGDAWIVPESTGEYVIAIPKTPGICYAYARSAGHAKSQRIFAAIANAPGGTFSVRKVRDEVASMYFGSLVMVAYEWTLSDSKKKTILKLSSTESESAPLQAHFSIIIGNQ